MGNVSLVRTKAFHEDTADNDPGSQSSQQARPRRKGRQARRKVSEESREYPYSGYTAPTYTLPVPYIANVRMSAFGPALDASNPYL